MDDLIRREDAIKAVMDLPDCPNGYSDTYDKARIKAALEDVLSAQPETMDEWCTDCKEYDQERHCCPRWNKVIRNTLKGLKEQT